MECSLIWKFCGLYEHKFCLYIFANVRTAMESFPATVQCKFIRFLNKNFWLIRWLEPLLFSSVRLTRTVIIFQPSITTIHVCGKTKINECKVSVSWNYSYSVIAHFLSTTTIYYGCTVYQTKILYCLRPLT